MKSILLMIMLGIATVSAQAQDTTTNIKNSVLDLSVPDSPAFTVLGLTTQSITHPASPRALATSLLNGVDQNGNFQTGVAVDTSPYLLFYGNGVTLQKYQESRVVRILSRTQFSFATTKGASDNDKSVRLAAGLSFTIFDKGDARLQPQYLKDLTDKAKAALDSMPPISPTASEDEKAKWKKDLEDKVEAATKPVRKEYERANWNRSSWIIAGAPSWISTDGTTSHVSFNGAAVWSSVAYGFEAVPGLKNNAQLILHARFHSSEEVPDPVNNGQFFKQQSEVFGGRFRFGTESTIGSFETVYVHTRPVGMATDRYFRLSVGAEKQLTGNFWLHFGIGGESGQKNGQNKLFILGAFKWGIGTK
jgi:hypothetical protein